MIKRVVKASKRILAWSFCLLLAWFGFLLGTVFSFEGQKEYTPYLLGTLIGKIMTLVLGGLIGAALGLELGMDLVDLFGLGKGKE